MQTETAIAVSVIMLPFIIFVVVLAWTDLTNRRARQ